MQVLNELGQSIGSALARIGAGDGAADDEAVENCLKEICTALLRVRRLKREEERVKQRKHPSIVRSLAPLSTPLLLKWKINK